MARANAQVWLLRSERSWSMSAGLQTTTEIGSILISADEPVDQRVLARVVELGSQSCSCRDIVSYLARPALKLSPGVSSHEAERPGKLRG
jgi:hypothetical protein